MYSSPTVVETRTTKQAQRRRLKAVICSACGHTNILQSRQYFWLLSKGKNARCVSCGRPLPLTS